jgi:ribosomal protein S18 acetylase RimI-like enzyme
MTEKKIKLRMVPNSKKYHEFIRQLRNDRRMKKGFIWQGNISKKQQVDYMKKYEKNYYICLADEQPAGFIGVIDSDIRVATHPDFQGLGIGTLMVRYLVKKRRNIQAKIKIDNVASVKLFEKCGFKLKYYLYESR